MSEIDVEQLEAKKQELQKEVEGLEAKKSEVADYEARKAALSKEEERLKTEIEKAREERRQKDVSFQDRLRTENLEAAKNKFFQQFEYSEEEKAKFDEGFKGFDSGSVNADLIYKDMLKLHVAKNPEKYIEMENRISRLTKEGQIQAADISSSGFEGSSAAPSGGEDGLTKDELLAAQWAGVTPERYKELKSKGLV